MLSYLLTGSTAFANGSLPAKLLPEDSVSGSNQLFFLGFLVELLEVVVRHAHFVQGDAQNSGDSVRRVEPAALDSSAFDYVRELLGSDSDGVSECFSGTVLLGEQIEVAPKVFSYLHFHSLDVKKFLRLGIGPKTSKKST